MGVEYCINAELDQRADLKMFLTFFRNIYTDSFEWRSSWDKNTRKRVDLPENYGEALKFFKHNYEEDSFSIRGSGKIGKNTGAPVPFFSGIEPDNSPCYTLCGINLGRHRNYSYTGEELFEEYDFRWHLEKLLEITNPYPIKRIWVENDMDGPKRVIHSTSFIVEGEVISSWSHSGDKVETRDAHYKGTTLLILERIAANALAYGAELDNFYFEELVNKPFPQEFTINTKHGSFIVTLGLNALMSVKPASAEQDVSDIRPYVEILTCLTRGLGLEKFRLYAGPQAAIAL